MREKTGGRKAGTKNRTILEKIDVWAEMEKLLQDPETKPETRYNILRTFAQYKHRKKSVNG